MLMSLKSRQRIEIRNYTKATRKKSAAASQTPCFPRKQLKNTSVRHHVLSMITSYYITITCSYINRDVKGS